MCLFGWAYAAKLIFDYRDVTAMFVRLCEICGAKHLILKEAELRK